MAWTEEQLRNAGIIYAVGQSMGMSNRDIQIGLITAMVESNLVNVNYGDRDSLGLFQQRPSMGWGSPEQVTNPEYAAGKFFSALKGLGDSRFGMGMGAAAQAVQRSAFPDRYAERIGQMRALWPMIQRKGGADPQALDGGSYFGPGGNPVLPDGITPEEVISDFEDPLSAVGPPDASAMLGAWGMSAQSLSQLEDLQVMPMVSQGTNDTVLKGIMEEVGAFDMPSSQLPGGKVDGWRAAVIEAARSALGTPYVWGGNSLSGGVDCSGLLQQAFARAGLDIPRVSYQQANFGQRVGLGDLRPGDLVAWDNSSRNNGADHIALYIGNGQIIEAARPGTVVRTRKLRNNEGAWGVRLNF